MTSADIRDPDKTSSPAPMEQGEPDSHQHIHGEHTAKPTLKSRLSVAFRVLLIAAALLFAVLFISDRWAEVVTALSRLSFPLVFLSFVAVMAGIICGLMSWQVLLEHLGPKVGVIRGAQIFLVGSIGKYVPGSVWAYILQIELGSRYGVARARVFASTLFSVAVAAVGSLLAGGLIVPMLVANQPIFLWLYALLPIGLVMLHPWVLTKLARLGFKLLRKPRPDHGLGYAVVAQSLGWALAAYVLYGIHLYLMASSIGFSGVGELSTSIGAMGIGMIAGLLAFFLPSGLGAREAIIVLVLGPTVGVGTATAFALLSRVMFTIADLAMASAGALTAVRQRRRDVPLHVRADEED
ncbi:lysylphosphatidylglycerol synthase transmembrane domain-containing protein [Arthrobacter cavernae]|uniref:Flippase-like domain-containing protein n=1 Tax=Arthrobacter cavernae TaxID=2817681 RepID=A0A939H9S3_9MICC|nr:lysylphosphatidylglycerol synthase transmembrane domain-containing protein [Arthrobacter cavernae]MBO1266859.1 flippase-like domain-containing protein [Arthrobacter cavernae]